MKKRSPFPWNTGNGGSIICDANWLHIADACWNAPDHVTRKHTEKAHAHCIARAKMICDTVNAAQERKP